MSVVYNTVATDYVKTRSTCVSALGHLFGRVAQLGSSTADKNCVGALDLSVSSWLRTSHTNVRTNATFGHLVLLLWVLPTAFLPSAFYTRAHTHTHHVVPSSPRWALEPPDGTVISTDAQFQRLSGEGGEAQPPTW